MNPAVEANEENQPSVMASWPFWRRFFLLFSFALVIIASTAVGYWNIAWEQEKRDIVADHSAKLERARGAAASRLEMVISDLLVLGKSDNLVRYLREANSRTSWTYLAKDFVTLSRQKRIYDRIRFIDDQGREKIRVVFNDGAPSISPLSTLEEKIDLPYVSEALRLDSDGIFISPIDLAIEDGALLVPHRPVLRISTPAYDGAGYKRGLLAINYLASDILDAFRPLLSGPGGEGMLFNEDGFWLLARNPSLEWGFARSGGDSFARSNSAVWREIIKGEDGFVVHESGLWVYQTVRPLLRVLSELERTRSRPTSHEERLAMNGYHWKAVVHVSPAELSVKRHQVGLPILYVGVALALLAGAVCWAAARASFMRLWHAQVIHEQKIWLETLVEAMPDAVYLKDGFGRWLVVNRTGLAIFGLEGQEYRGMTEAELASLHPEKREALLACTVSDDEAWRGKVISRGEEIIPTPDGDARIFDVYKVPLFDDSDNRQSLVVVGRDVTEQRLLLDEMHRLSRLNELILNSAAEGIFGLDRDGRVAFVNAAGAAMLCWAPEHIIGRRFDTVVYNMEDEDKANRLEAALGLDVEGGLDAKRVHQDKFTRKNGEIFRVECVAAPVAFSDLLSGAVVICRDITEQFDAEKRVQAAMAELTRSNADLEQFAYAASHDLREPLRQIISYLQLLKRRYGSSLGEDADTFINYAVDGARRLDGLILDLLDYSRIGRVNAKQETLSFKEPLDEALANLELIIKESGAEITLPETLPFVFGSRSELTRLMQNLIGNALKYRSPDRKPVIKLSIRRDGGEWRFAVTDNGIGIAPEFHERIFRIFQRLHLRGEYEGTGIGLAMCKKIVEGHGGGIWVESTPGEGCCFCFSLPAIA
jgi:PAS domain S-box-containing protein